MWYINIGVFWVKEFIKAIIFMIWVTIEPKIQDGGLKLPKNMKKSDQMYRKEL